MLSYPRYHALDVGFFFPSTPAYARQREEIEVEKSRAAIMTLHFASFLGRELRRACTYIAVVDAHPSTLFGSLKSAL